MFKNTLKTIFPYFATIIVVLFIKIYIVSPVMVNGISMEDTLHNHDVMILNKIGFRLNGAKRFDIVVVNIGKTKIIKRVIGLPGETIEYKDGILYINDKEVIDKYNNGHTPNIPKMILSDSEYFVLGDNRGISLDSSELGPMDKKYILGKTKLRIWPLNKIGLK